MSVIKVQNLSKKYRLHHEAQRYRSLREEIMSAVRGISIRRKKTSSSSDEDFWALKDVNFEVNQGDRLGIIGRNGAGKSTLLKILSRITEPTEGRVEIAGRVSSLLEVGTGFHPELTGRENIFLNGAILGMRVEEVRRKFDQIVDFAEVERFLDTPVKRYSSGMYVRLAFAVAAHLEPDLLIIDEVLAVGDANFQKRCIHKMEDSSREGRTIIFVSHNMSAIETFCNRVIYLDSGCMHTDSFNVKDGIRAYISGAEGQLPASWFANQNSPAPDWFTPLSFRLVNSRGDIISGGVSYQDELWCVIDAEVKKLDIALTIGIALYDEDGHCLFWSYQTDLNEDEWPKMKEGNNLIKVKLPLDLLNGGVYRVELIGGLHFREWLFQPGINAPSIYFVLNDLVSSSPYWIHKRPSLIAPKLKWIIY
jgi:lipopolysaccharide transport system ATP-binding protein